MGLLKSKKTCTPVYQIRYYEKLGGQFIQRQVMYSREINQALKLGREVLQAPLDPFREACSEVIEIYGTGMNKDPRVIKQYHRLPGLL